TWVLGYLGTWVLVSLFKANRSGRSQKPKVPRRGCIRIRVSHPSRLAKAGAASFVCFLCFLVLLASAMPCAASDALAKDAHADKVLVLKSERTLELLDHGKILKKYKVALGSTPVGKKVKQGDHKTPEGLYILDRRNEHSQFYRSLHISYPSSEDRDRARKSGTAPGGDITLHGLPNGYGWIGSRH